MTVTASRLRSWSPEELGAAAAGLRETESVLVELQQGVHRAVDAMTWESPAATAAVDAAADLVRALDTLAQSFAMQAEALSRAGGALQAAQDVLARAAEVAAQHGLTMFDDGDVSQPPPNLMSADPPDADRQRAAGTFAAAQDASERAGAMAREALAAAAEADRDAARALQAGDPLGALLARIVPGAAGVLEQTTTLEACAMAEQARLLAAVDGRAAPAAGSDPDEVSAWWASLTPAAQAAQLTGAPQLLGNLDGLPASVRHEANRARLAQERADLETEIARLERALDDSWFGGTFTDDDARLAYAKAKLEGLARIEEVMSRSNRMLLLLDTSGEQLKAALANGDVDTADHVAVFTGGLGTDVAGDLSRYDNQMADLKRQSGDMAARGRTGSVAVVTWLGYEAPQSVSEVWRPGHSVAGTGAAENGAVRLAAFYNGLDSARSRPAHLVALGHSYGSLTTGLSLQHGTGVDDVVFFGSPGIGTDDVRELGVRPGHVYVAEARKDPVADFATFGDDPNHLDGVHDLSTARSVVDGVERAESVGHSEYLHDRTTSQYGISAVVAGLPDLVPRGESSGAGDVLRDSLRPPPPVILPPGLPGR